MSRYSRIYILYILPNLRPPFSTTGGDRFLGKIWKAEIFMPVIFIYFLIHLPSISLLLSSISFHSAMHLPLKCQRVVQMVYSVLVHSAQYLTVPIAQCTTHSAC